MSIKESERSLRLKKEWQDPVQRAKRIRAMTGHLVSQATRDKIGRANKKSCRTPEYRRKMSLERGGVSVKAYPLFLRGGLVEEVAKITGLERNQVENLRNLLRKRGGLKRPTKEEESLAKRKAHLGKPSRSERVYTSHQEKASLLARKFLEAELFTEDLSAWNELQELYHKYGRPLPEDFAGQLRLEVFLKVRRHLISKDPSLLLTYRNFGEEIDLLWFDKNLTLEEDFIGSKTGVQPGYQEDEKGFYRVDKEGRRWRPIENFTESGGIIFDNSNHAEGRKQVRERT